MTLPGKEWDEHLARFPEATFYHTRIWARIVSAAFPGLEDVSRWIGPPDRRAALPLFTWRRVAGLFQTRQSSFPFLYGGPVPRRNGDHDLLAGVLNELDHGWASLLVFSNPFAPGEAACPRNVSPVDEVTHILRLPARYEEYWDSILTPAKRNDIRRLSKQGLTLRCGVETDEIATVYRFYRDSFRRWGSRPRFVYPEALYQAMIRLGEGNIRLYLAEHQGRIVGGAFIVRWNGHVHYHAGYFDHAARSLRPNVFLQERIIRDAIADGYRQYDLLPSGGNRGVEVFKEGWGAVRTPLLRYGYASPAHRLMKPLRGLIQKSRSTPPGADER